MKLFFAWIAEPAAARTQLALYRRSVETHLAAFEEMGRGLPARGEPVHSQIALRHGILRARATLEWADEAAALLESVTADETLDQAAGGRAGGD